MTRAPWEYPNSAMSRFGQTRASALSDPSSAARPLSILVAIDGVRYETQVSARTAG